MHVERGYSGTEVQRLHIAMGKSRIPWPPLKLPFHRGSMTVMDVIAFPPGLERDHAINAWCRSVWEAFAINRPAIAELLVSYGIG